MKNLVTVCFLVLLVFNGSAQITGREEIILTSYYSIKDGLVQRDAKISSDAAKLLIHQLEAFHPENKNTKDQKLVDDLKKKIKADAKIVAEGKSIEIQRAAFASLSISFFEIAKVVDLTPSALYQFYCPMKKSIWLSSENMVKNPYYGKQMLTCGSLQETIK